MEKKLNDSIVAEGAKENATFEMLGWRLIVCQAYKPFHAVPNCR